MTKKKKTRAKRKTAEQMLAETNAKAKALEEKIAMKSTMDNPQVLVFTALLEDLTKQTIEYQKGFGNGPQSFETRRLTHQLWVEEIDASYPPRMFQFHVPFSHPFPGIYWRFSI